MLHITPGTSVPKFSDSPNYSPNFKKVKRKKSPIIGITSEYRPYIGLFQVTVFRDKRPPRKYATKGHIVTMLIKILCHQDYRHKVHIQPNLMGWTAYIDQRKGVQ